MLHKHLLSSLFPVLLFFMAGASLAHAATRSEADSAYAKKNYVEAAHIYEALATKNTDSDVFYNLGNAYYRMNDFPRAILNYERALKQNPGNKDAAYNLEVCRSKASVPSGQAAEMFFITWADRLVRSQSADFWGMCALFGFVLGLGCWIVYSQSTRVAWRKAGFSAMSLFGLLLVFCLVSATLQGYRFRHEVKAVVMSGVRLSTDETETRPTLLVAGMTVVVIDESPDGKLLVESADKRLRGWIPAQAVAKV